MGLGVFWGSVISSGWWILHWLIMVFRFGDSEMTPLLEEIGGFAGLLWDSPGLFVPENRTTRGFFKMMELKKNDDLE